MYELRLTIKMTSISLENLEDTYEGFAVGGRWFFGGIEESLGEMKIGG
jgi:hypothetical protein